MEIIPAISDTEIGQARELLREYAASVGFSLCFQNFDRELAELPGAYSAPDGRLLLAVVDVEPVGCVALRKLTDGVGEMKRLFLRSTCRGQKAGRRLAQAVIEEARRIGYGRIRLMREAIALYRSLGFVEIEPYTFNPVPGALFMELPLAGEAKGAEREVLGSS